MPSPLIVLGAFALAFTWVPSADAASLRVAPTTLELLAPEAAAALNLRNEAARPINVQLRVFRWTQRNGVERLEPTTDVVASPPSTTLGPNTNYVARVVRVASRPVVGEEEYRVVVDELPDPSRRQAGVVAVVLRFSVPVFFRASDASASHLSWIVRPRGSTLIVEAINSGQRYRRIANLQIKTRSDHTLTLRPGLVGYVLGQGKMQWLFPIGGLRVSGASVTLSADTDGGRISATAKVLPQR